MFDYFYENQSEQYLFLQLPLMLIKDDQFKRVTDSSKILYSLLLNRTSLSTKNGWRDEQGRVYIIFTIEEIMEDLNCAKEKATKSMKELKDIGLIETVRRGLGLPNLIYVKNFATSLKYHPKNPQTPAIPQKFDNRTSGSSETEIQDGREIETQEVRKSNPSNIYHNNINSIDIESSQGQRQTTTPEEKPDMTSTMTPDVSNKNIFFENKRTPTQVGDPKYNMGDYATYEQLIKDNVDYSHYAAHDKSKLEMFDSLIQIILDVILTSDPPTVKIGKETKSRDIVRSVYLKINSQHIEHIIEQYEAQHHKITHKTAYLRTMLYTVGQEIDAHYTNLVRADGAVW